jgi:hypothetical protein
MRLKFAVISMVIVACGVARAAEAQSVWTPNLAPLTAQDYWSIHQLYGEYTRWLEYGADTPNGTVRAEDVFAPDGMFVMVTPTVAGKPCAVPAPAWKAGGRDVIRGTIVDRIGANACIATLTGSKALAEERLSNRKGSTALTRQLVFNIYIQPAPGGGASGHAPALMRPENATDKKWFGGVYEDEFVKTSNGWRIKKRVWFSDEVIGAWRPKS